MSKRSEYLRENSRKKSEERNKGLVEPAQIEQINDIAYGPLTPWQTLDLYKPKQKTPKDLPVIISIHGGGWIGGSKEEYKFYCLSLAEQGFAIINCNYRLAPEYTYPSPLEDIERVIDWSFQHSKEYGLDTTNIFMIGDSAGAHLLGMYLSLYPFRPKAVAFNCGKFHITENDPHDRAIELMKDFLPGEVSLEALEKINVFHTIDQNYPPVYIVTSQEDFLQSQTIQMVAILQSNKVPFTFQFYASKTHTLNHVFHIDLRIPEAKICNTNECNYFKTLIDYKR